MLKKHRILFIILSITLLIGCSKKKENSPSNGISIVDDLKVTVNFEEPPQRIISLAPSLTEMIYKINYDKYLIGNTLYCNYPEDAQKKVKAGANFIVTGNVLENNGNANLMKEFATAIHIK